MVTKNLLMFVNLHTPREKSTSKSVKWFTQTFQGVESVSEINKKGLFILKHFRP